MKAILVCILFLSSSYLAAAADLSQRPDDCGVALMYNFKKWNIAHNIQGTKVNKINYVTFNVSLKATNISGCEAEYSTALFYKDAANKNQSCKADDNLVENSDTRTHKSYTIQVAKVNTIYHGTKKVNNTVYSYVRFTLVIYNALKERIRQIAYLQYLLIDETTNAVNEEETRADTNITKTEIWTDSEDCDAEQCREVVLLETIVKCYVNNTYAAADLITKDTLLIVGDTIYCEVTFKDPTIKRYIHIKTVNVTTPDKQNKDVVNTGYYTEGRRTKSYTRFSILTYWPEKMAHIQVNSKISLTALCQDEDCVECDKSQCLDCRSGLLPQVQECVANCDGGYYLKLGSCQACKPHCKACKTYNLCQACSVPHVLYNTNCHASCPRGYSVKNGACVKLPALSQGIKNNVDLSYFTGHGCAIKYQAPWGHRSLDNEIQNVRDSCSASTLIVFGAISAEDDSQLVASATDNCVFALQAETDPLHKYKKTRSRLPGLYWFWSSKKCIGYSTHTKVMIATCHSVSLNDGLQPQVQYHLNGVGVGYSALGSKNSKLQKIILTCAV